MDAYTIWWEIAGAMTVVSGLAGALMARPESRSIGLVLGGIAAAYAGLNLMGSLEKDHPDVVVTTAIATFVAVVMLAVFIFSWFVRRRRD
jgi:hypothetical protein